MQTRHIRARLDATLGHADTPRRYFFHEPERRFKANFEGVQIPTVNSDQVAPGVQRPAQLLLVMHFAQHVEAVGPRNSGKRYEFLRLERGDNQQDGIGPVGTRFQYLKLIDDEVLAQARNRAVRCSLA